MIILGLGSNLGDKLANLRLALHAIKSLPDMVVHQVSPVYISDALLPENAPQGWDYPYLNLALRCNTTLKPFELLEKLKEIEWRIGRKPEVRHWGPRVIDIDILAWDELIIQTDKLTLPHDSLQKRPFALWPLADVAPLWKFPLAGKYHGKTAAEIAEHWGSRFSGEAPFHTKQLYQRIDTPQLVGIINITPDSFSDGGHFINPEKALDHAIQLVNDGAEILDIGAESTAPAAKPLDPATEWQRLQPVLSAIQAAKNKFILQPKISVDTRHVEVAKRSLDYGVEWINDVTGLNQSAMRELVQQSGKECVVMHHMSIPANREHVLARNEDVVKLIYDWAAKHLDSLDKIGIPREKIIFDPGIGFGKSPEHSLQLIKDIHIFKTLNTRILIGHSRKNFLSQFTPYASSERDIETLAVSLYLMNQSVDYLRVHNVELCARGMRVMRAF
ncbi:MAG: dihydropteroate synthase [Gammaproteobacteria bacterium]|nr:dihydropteroate synthase [Gammaproteobacteria bacterium]